MRGAEIDHKVGEIRMRPIENSMDGPKKTISDIFSDLGSAVIESIENDIICSSTEEVLETFEEYNKKRDENINGNGTDNIIGSMDAVSLFTRLEAERSAEIVKEE